MAQIAETPTLTSASFEELVREMIVRLGEDPPEKDWCVLQSVFTKSNTYS